MQLLWLSVLLAEVEIIPAWWERYWGTAIVCYHRERAIYGD